MTMVTCLVGVAIAVGSAANFLDRSPVLWGFLTTVAALFGNAMFGLAGILGALVVMLALMPVCTKMGISI